MEEKTLEIHPKIVTTFSPTQKAEDTYLIGQQTTKTKRDLKQILAEALYEAEIAGPDFYYAYPLKGTVVEGPSIGMMTSLARIWGKLKIDTETEETQDAWIYKVRVKDLETDLEFNTIYRQRKPRKFPEKMDPARWEDMQFQAGLSKALRNALTKVIPRWLQSACLKKAKEAIIGMIDKPEKVIKTLILEFSKFNITKEDLEELLGISVTDWTPEEIVTLRGILNQIKEGILRPSELKGQLIEVKVEEVQDKKEELKNFEVDKIRAEVNEKIIKGIEHKEKEKVEKEKQEEIVFKEKK